MLKPYPSTKPSGLPWAPLIPSHWNAVPNRALLRRRKVLVGAKHDAYALLSLTKAGVIVRDVASGKGKFSADMGTCQEVRSGDIVFCLFDVPETPRTVGLSHHDGMITGAYTVFECDDPKVANFVAFFYQAMDDRKLLSPLYSGLRNTIPPNRLLGVRTPLPPADEQIAILRFLAYAERRIRHCIRGKRHLISLLDEQRQFVIETAVLRGLDSEINLKRSGVEWMGNVPEHWEVKRARFLFREVDRRSRDGSELRLSMSQTLGLVPSELVANRTLVSESYAGGKLCEVGDLVLNRLKAHLGVFSVAQHAGVVSPDYTVLRPVEPVGTSYFEYVLRSQACRGELSTRAKGIVEGFWRLYTDDFYDIALPVPPAEERCRIIESVGRLTGPIDDAIAEARKQIDLLRDFGTRLIADAVTGNLDVREAAARLPVHVYQHESLGEIDIEETDVADVEDLESVEV